MRKLTVLLATMIVIFSNNVAVCQDLERIVGGWANTDLSIAILKGQFGWDVWLENSGRARISRTDDNGANIRITSNAFDCYYYASLLNGGSLLLLHLTKGSEVSCLQGNFARIDDSASGASAELDSILAAPERPVSERWKINITCQGGGYINIADANFVGGLYAFGTSDSSQKTFATYMSIGYKDSDNIEISGYAGGKLAPFKFLARRREGDKTSYLGSGTWSGGACSIEAQQIGPMWPPPVLPPPSWYSGAWDLEVACPGGGSFTASRVVFVYGRAAVGFEEGVHEFSIQPASDADTVRLTGYSVWPDSTVSLIDVSASKSSESNTYSGGGSFGSAQSCSFKAVFIGQ